MPCSLRAHDNQMAWLLSQRWCDVGKSSFGMCERQATKQLQRHQLQITVQMVTVLSTDAASSDRPSESGPHSTAQQEQLR
jgi:hypothetical protein